MNIQYYKHYSSHLNRDMEFKVYGHGGKPILFIPCQAGRYWDFESFHMIDHWGKWIEEGRCTVYSIDTIDNEAWAAQGEELKDELENKCSDESDYFDNIPENLQGSQRAMDSEEAIDKMNEAIESMDNAIGAAEEAASCVDEI